MKWPEGDMKNSRHQSNAKLSICGFLVLMTLGGMARESAWARTRNIGEGPTLKVGVYNYAHIGSLELREAEGVAGRLFDHAGIRIVWVDCALAQEEIALHPQCSNSDVVLRFLPASMTAGLNEHAEALGQSVGWGENGRAWSANVFCARAMELASSWNLNLAQILGDAAAHELGHLLLGPGHARKGIMVAVWSPQDLESASRGGLQFTADETSLLKAAVATMGSKAHALIVAGNQ
jgi:hypothetical protein